MQHAFFKAMCLNDTTTHEHWSIPHVHGAKTNHQAHDDVSFTVIYTADKLILAHP